MKKLMMTLILMILGFSFLGCQKPNTSSTEGQVQSQTSDFESLQKSSEGIQDPKSLPFEPDEMKISLSNKKEISGWVVQLSIAELDILHSQSRFTGSVQKTSVVNGVVSIGVENNKTCSLTLDINSELLQKIKEAIQDLKICSLKPDLQMGCPEMFSYLTSAPLIFSKGSAKIYISNNACFIAQHSEAFSLCKDETILQGLMGQLLSDSVFQKCFDEKR